MRQSPRSSHHGEHGGHGERREKGSITGGEWRDRDDSRFTQVLFLSFSVFSVPSVVNHPTEPESAGPEDVLVQERVAELALWVEGPEQLLKVRQLRVERRQVRRPQG